MFEITRVNGTFTPTVSMSQHEVTASQKKRSIYNFDNTEKILT